MASNLVWGLALCAATSSCAAKSETTVPISIRAEHSAKAVSSLGSPEFANFDVPGGEARRVIAVVPGLWLSYTWAARRGYPESVGDFIASGKIGFRSDLRSPVFRNGERLFGTLVDPDLANRGGKLVALNASYLEARSSVATPCQRCPSGTERFDEAAGDEAVSSCWFFDALGEPMLVDLAFYDAQGRLRSYARPVQQVVPAAPDPRRMEWPTWGVENTLPPDPLIAHSVGGPSMSRTRAPSLASRVAATGCSTGSRSSSMPTIG